MAWTIRRYEKPAGWVFYWQTLAFREAVERGASAKETVLHALFGNAPFIVFAHTGEVCGLSGNKDLFNAMLRELGETGQWDYESKKRDFPALEDWFAHAQPLGLTDPLPWTEELHIKD